MYKRILIKLSGEALSGGQDKNIFNIDMLKGLANMFKMLHDEGIEIGVVIGAGNIWRGRLATDIGFKREPADYMGMLGTVINAVALSQALGKIDVPSVVFSALGPVADVVKDYNANDAKKALSEGKIVFFAAGVGLPFYTTDSGASKRALETDCEAIFMAKNGIKGVYDSDPRNNPKAKFFKEITYQQIIDMGLQVMDIEAVKMLKDSDLQIRVFSMEDYQNIIKVVHGDSMGTTIKRG